MKKRTLVLIAIMAGAMGARAAVMYFEDFTGSPIGYSADSQVHAAPAYVWADFKNRYVSDALGTASTGESVLQATVSANDGQFRTLFDLGFDGAEVTNITLRIRQDSNNDGTFDAQNAESVKFWITALPYPDGIGNVAITELTETSVTADGAGGWYLFNYQPSLTNSLRGIRLDPDLAVSADGKIEIDYLLIEGTGAPFVVPDPPLTNTVVQWEFNGDGDTEGWEGLGIDTLTTAGGVLTSAGVLSNDPQITRGDLYSPSGDYWFKAELRLRQLDANGVPQAFDATGTTMVINGTIFNSGIWDMVEEGSGEWITASVLIYEFGTNLLSGLRFDPIGSAANTNKNFEVDYFRLLTTANPPPAASEALIQAWEFNTPGNVEGFYETLFNGLSIAVSSGGESVLTSGAAAGNDPKLFAPSNLVLSATSWDRVELRIRQLAAPGGAAQAWVSGGTVVVLNSTTFSTIPSTLITISNEANEWVSAVVDISAFPGNINTIRIDPIGTAAGVGKSFELDYVRVYGQVVNPFDLWAYEEGLSGADALAMADPDEDGAENFAEYVFGGNPNDPLDVGMPAEGRMIQAGGSNVLEYVYFELQGKEAAGVDYSLEATANLVFSSWTNDFPYTVTGTQNVDNGMRAVTNRIPTVESKTFIRVKAVGQ